MRRTIVSCALAVLAVAVSIVVQRPVSANPLAGIVAISVGDNHACAVTTGGGVKCWGDNNLGELGDGSTASSSVSVDVNGLNSGVAAVSAGGRFTCALTTGGGVKCWGNNERGQLGNGTTANSNTPVGVMGLADGIASISAGADRVCGVTTSGGVKCWGADDFGELGDGTTGDPSCFCRTVPVDATVLAVRAEKIATAVFHTCALTIAGGVKCWGVGGLLGDGTNNDSTTPVDVLGLTSGVTAISARNFTTCALTTAGGIKCWGDNSEGQVGDGTVISRNAPVDVTGLSSGAAALGVGNWHVCAVIASGGVRCWGLNEAGQLGTGANTGTNSCAGDFPCYLVPTAAVGLSAGAAAFSAGDDFGCAFMVIGEVKCWGLNYAGQLGIGTNVGPETCIGAACSTTPLDVVLQVKPTPTPTATATPPPAVGGVSLDPGVASSAARTSSPRPGVLPFAALAFVAVSAAVGAAWLARRRLRRWR